MFMNFLKGLFKKEEEVKTEISQNVTINSDLPINEDYWFRVNGTLFLGRCLYSNHNKLHFVVKHGVFATSDPVTVVQKATPEEAREIGNTVHEVESNYVVRFLAHPYDK